MSDRLKIQNYSKIIGTRLTKNPEYIISHVSHLTDAYGFYLYDTILKTNILLTVEKDNTEFIFNEKWYKVMYGTTHLTNLSSNDLSTPNKCAEGLERALIEYNKFNKYA